MLQSNPSNHKPLVERSDFFIGGVLPFLHTLNTVFVLPADHEQLIVRIRDIPNPI
jgi:hypothetical protein